MKIYFKTYGCKVNQYETQLLRERLCKSSRNESVDDIALADICIINSCTVTHNADSDCRQIVRRIKKTNLGSRIVVTGCYAIRAPEEIKKLFPEVIIEQDKEKIPGILSPGDLCDRETISYFHDHSRAFVKIQDGCNAFCGYCIVPYVRDKLSSKPRELVFEETEALVKNGYKEVVLCGICLGKYNDGKNFGLVELVKEVLTKFEGLKIHFSSLEILEITDELVELTAKNGNIVRHLHIPLQSADDEVLKLMNRPYNCAKFQERLDYIRGKIPGIRLTTDVLVGFPTETRKQFENTHKFLLKNKFHDIHIFRYSPRPGTKAFGMKPGIPSSEIKSRARLLSSLKKKSNL